MKASKPKRPAATKRQRAKTRQPNLPRGEVRFLVEPGTRSRIAEAKASGDAYIAKLDSSRRFTVPKPMCDRFDIHAGDSYRVKVADGEVILIFPARRSRALPEETAGVASKPAKRKSGK